jgi:DNA-binding SARP family transcriptional activator
MPGTRGFVSVADGEIPPLTLHGGFGLYRGNYTVPLTPNAQRLVALPALHGTALRRDYVAELLWSDSTEARVCGSLRSVLWKLQFAVPELVPNQGGTLRLDPHVDVDIRRTSLRCRHPGGAGGDRQGAAAGSAHRALMRVHIAGGDAREAVMRYRHYEKIAARELGVEPSPLMRSLLGQIPLIT